MFICFVAETYEGKSAMRQDTALAILAFLAIMALFAAASYVGWYSWEVVPMK
jgi:hypothetical protein